MASTISRFQTISGQMFPTISSIFRIGGSPDLKTEDYPELFSQIPIELGPSILSQIDLKQRLSPISSHRVSLLQDHKYLDLCRTNLSICVTRKNLRVISDALAENSKSKTKCSITSITVQFDEESLLSVDEENLIRIFKFCPHLQSVDFKSQKLSTNLLKTLIQYLGNTIDTLGFDGSAHVTDEIILEVANRCTKLKSLKANNCPALTDGSILAIAQKCPELNTLQVRSSSVTDLSVIEVIRSCKTLQDLEIGGCFITDGSIFALAQPDSLIQNLNIDLCKEITSDSLIEMASKCRNLTHLSASGVVQLNNLVIHEIGKRCSLLETLNISGCSLIDDLAFINQAGSLMTEWPHLQNLNLDRCPGLSDASVALLVAYSPQLRSLNIDHCRKIHSPLLGVIATHSNELRELYLSDSQGWDLDLIYQITTNCIHLKHVYGPVKGITTRIELSNFTNPTRRSQEAAQHSEWNRVMGHIKFQV